MACMSRNIRFYRIEQTRLTQLSKHSGTESLRLQRCGTNGYQRLVPRFCVCKMRSTSARRWASRSRRSLSSRRSRRSIQRSSRRSTPLACKMADRRQIVGGLIDGPLAFDNAVSKEAVAIKHIVSLVAGDADVLVAPDLEAANMIAKQLVYLAGAEAAGIVLGARVPIILTSRADGPLARMASCALAQLFVHRAGAEQVARRKRARAGSSKADCDQDGGSSRA